MADHDRIVAVSLLTEQELTAVGQGLRRIYPIASDGAFTDLLLAIDRADEQRMIIPVLGGKQQ